MNWRRLYFGYIDPALGLSRKQRGEVWKRAHRLPGAWWRLSGLGLIFIALLELPIVVQIAVVNLVDPMIALDIFGELFRWSLIGALVLVVPCVWVYHRRVWRRPVIVALQSMGHEVCDRCGYWQKGLADDVKQCPECGTRRRRAVCPNCGKKLPGLGLGGVVCPGCEYRLDKPLPPEIPRFGFLVRHATVDPRLRSELSRSERIRMKRGVTANWSAQERAMVVAGTVILMVPIMAVLLVLAAGCFGSNTYFWANLKGLEALAVFLVLGSLFVGPAVILWIAYDRVYGRPLLRILRLEGYEVCVRCGYWMVDLRDEIQECPACRSRREPMPGTE